MSKADFFQQLQERLRGLPDEERQNIVHVYEDLFRQAEAGGKSEEEIIRSLGYIPVPVPGQQPPPFTQQPKPPSRAAGGTRAVMAAIALGLFNLIFLLGPFIAAAALLFSLSLVAVLFAFSPIWVFIGTGIPASMEVLLLELFTSLTLTGLGVMLGMAMWKLNHGFLDVVKRYTALNLKLIRGD